MLSSASCDVSAHALDSVLGGRRAWPRPDWEVAQGLVLGLVLVLVLVLVLGLASQRALAARRRCFRFGTSSP